MRSSLRKPVRNAFLLSLLAAAVLMAAGRQVLFVKAPPGATVAKRGAMVEIPIRAELLPGYHVNSDKPEDEYLIPLRLTWESEPLEVVEVQFPKAEMESYSFSEKPLSVYTGDFDIVSRFKTPQGAPTGVRTLSGKLRYQACSDKLCLPPKTIPFTLDVEIQ